MNIVERLREGNLVIDYKTAQEAADEIERLREALQKIADWPDYRSPSHQEIARAALKEKENV